MAAKRDVPPLKAFLFIPSKLIITDHTVRASEIAFIITEHPQIFKKHFDAEYLRLIVFIFYERLKGDRSFWKPYFDIVNFTDLPFLWEDKEVEEVQDQILQREVEDYKKEFEEEWALIRDTFREHKYDAYFPGISEEEKEKDLKQVFLISFIGVITRCFGWGLPTTMVVPFADCINHHNVDSNYEMIHRKWHFKEEQGPDHYYTKSKLEVDYSDFFEEEEKQDRKPPFKTLNYCRRVLKRKQAQSQKLHELAASKATNIWDCDYLSTSDAEDNDSNNSDSSSTSEDEEEKCEGKAIAKKRPVK